MSIMINQSVFLDSNTNLIQQAGEGNHFFVRMRNTTDDSTRLMIEGSTLVEYPAEAMRDKPLVSYDAVQQTHWFGT